jgi:pectate lyase
MPSTGGSPGTGGTQATGGAGGGSGCPDSIVGFATVSGTTSGGEGGEVVSVSDATQLISAVSGSTARTVRISGSIAVSRLEVGSNKTLLGVGNAASIRGGVLLDGSQNVIVKNLSIDGASTSIEDAMTVTGGSRHVWIDHCTIFNAPDGNLDIVHGSDFVTVSWTRFYYSRGGDHRFSNLVGHSDDNEAEDENALRITFHHNWWAEGVIERMPRVRFGQVHSFNNYFSSSGNNYCIRAAKASEVLIENNYFDGVNDPHQISNEDGSPARVVQRGSAYAGGTSGDMHTAGTVFSPPYSYSPDPAGGVLATVRQCAGPR